MTKLIAMGITAIRADIQPEEASETGAGYGRRVLRQRPDRHRRAESP